MTTENTQSNSTNVNSNSNQLPSMYEKEQAPANKPKYNTKEKIEISSGIIMAIATGVIAAFTIVLAWASYEQYEIFKISVTDARRSADSSYAIAKKSIEISNKSLMMTRNSIDDARKNFIIENRAYVLITRIDVDTTNKGMVIVTLYAKNNGKVAADVQIGSERFFGSDINIPSPDSSIYIDNNKRKFTIGATDTKIWIENFYYNPGVNNKFKKDLRKGITQMYLIANITYQDIFKVPRYIHFCRRYDIRTNTFWAIGKYNDSN